MSAVAEQNATPVSQLASLAKATASPAPAWLESIRQRALHRFEELGLPGSRNEEWKYTSLAPLARASFRRAGTGEALSGINAVQSLKPHYVFINGVFSAELSQAPVAKGLRVSSLRTALQSGNPVVEKHLARYAGFEDKVFVALNTAAIEDGVLIEIPQGTVEAQPVHLLYLSAPGAAPSISQPRNLIVAGPHSQASIIETYAGIDGQVYFTNTVTEIIAGESSVIDHYKLQQESDAAFHIGMLHVALDRSANFTTHCISLGGALVRNQIQAVLAEGSEATLNGLYLVDGRQHVDNHTTIDHAKPNASSHELYKGILDGRSSAVFNGRIIVRPDAQKTDAKQTNKNLVLSENAVINTKPQLEIYANDVRCTHGATIGQLDNEAIFYLQSRGIGRQEARQLLVLAFARDVLDRMKVESVREQMESVLVRRLAGRMQ